MAGIIHDNVFDAALSHVASNAVSAIVLSNDSSALVDQPDAAPLDANNFNAPENNDLGGGGRMIDCLVEDTGDMSGWNVSTAGVAQYVGLYNDASVLLIRADITGAPINLSASDSVNLGEFKVALKDPA